MKRALLAAVPLLVAQLGCTVSAVSASDDPRPNNACKSDSDCGDGQCSQNVCQTPNGQLEALLISASPPSDSAIPHLTFVKHVADVPTSGGAKDIELLGPSHVIGSLTLPKGETCYPGFVSDDPQHPILPAVDGKSLPVTVTLALHERLLGLPQQVYFATTASKFNDLGGYAFDVQLPGGDYDVYLVPPKRQEVSCPVPPQLYRGFTIDQRSAEITFQLSGVSTLPFAIRWPKSSQSLTGWVVDIIEPVGGNAISTELVLGEPADVGDSAVQYKAHLVYSTVVRPGAAAALKESGDLLRLRPPAGLVAPTIFIDRSVLGLLTSRGDTLVYKRFAHVPSAVTVKGLMARVDTREPVAGSVTLVSTEIYGVDDGIFASYRTTVEVGDDGAIDVALPPGVYKVLAVPPVVSGAAQEALALGALEAEVPWEVPTEPNVQYGKLLELRPIAEVTGQSRFQGAQVFAVPSPRRVSPFEEAFGIGSFSPRATSGLVDQAGRFTVQADPGRFDVSVQAPETLGFAWFVRPGVEVGRANQDLGRITLPIPALLYGTAGVSLAGTVVPLASAAIRAYAYLDEHFAYTRDPKAAVTVVQVAETRADDKGAFRLLLPSKIDAPE